MSLVRAEGSNTVVRKQTQSHLELWSSLVRDERFNDITFLIGPGRAEIGGNRALILAAVPPESILHQQLAQPQINRIVHRTLEPRTVSAMIHYITTGELLLTKEMLEPCLDLSVEWKLRSWETDLAEYIWEHIDDFDPCHVIYMSGRVTSSQLRDLLELVCLPKLDLDPEVHLESKHFPRLTRLQVYKILSRDTLRASKELVFRAAVRWAVAECSRRGKEPFDSSKAESLGNLRTVLEPPAEERREELGPNPKCVILFPMLSMSEFNTGALRRAVEFGSSSAAGTSGSSGSNGGAIPLGMGAAGRSGTPSPKHHRSTPTQTLGDATVSGRASVGSILGRKSPATQRSTAVAGLKSLTWGQSSEVRSLDRRHLKAGGSTGGSYTSGSGHSSLSSATPTPVPMLPPLRRPTSGGITITGADASRGQPIRQITVRHHSIEETCHQYI